MGNPCVQIQVLSFTGWVTLGKLLDLPKPHPGPPFWNPCKTFCSTQHLQYLSFPLPASQTSFVFWLPVSQSFRDLGLLVTWSVLLSIFPIHVFPPILAASVGMEAPQRLPTCSLSLYSCQVPGGQKSVSLQGFWLTVTLCQRSTASPVPTNLCSREQLPTSAWKVLNQVSNRWVTLINMIIQEITTVPEEKYWRLVFWEEAKKRVFSRPWARFDPICFILLICFGI